MNFLQLKNLVGRFIGESDGSGTDSVRDALINDALKEFASRHPFRYNQKTASLTVSSGVVSLPSDFDYSHTDDELIKIYSYSGTDKTTYIKVELDDLDSSTDEDFVYAIDEENGQLKSNHDATLSFKYFSIPTDLTDNSDVTRFPIPEAIARQAAGQYWQSIEEDDTGQSQVNFASAEALFSKAVFQDNKGKKNKVITHYLKGRNMGFN